MENKTSTHLLVVPYPSQGHVNPMLQFCKHLTSYGLKITFATTVFISKTFTPKLFPSIQLDTISDGFDDGGYGQSSSVDDYLARLEVAGSKTLAELIKRHHFDCVVYDSFLPWALDVAKQFGLPGGPFFTQACTANYVYYCVHYGLLKLPVSSFPLSIDGLQLLRRPHDMPSFVGVAGSYPSYFEIVLGQFSNTDQADFVLVNSVYEFEQEVRYIYIYICSFIYYLVIIIKNCIYR